MNFDELCKRTHELASNGADWNRVLFDDVVNDAYSELSRSGELDKEKLELAFVEGRREYRVSKGWVVVWTTAKADYDQFDTEELECHEWRHKTLRKVLVHPDYAIYQRSRYMSGAAVWDEDPREVEHRIKETIARENAEREEKNRVREEGLAWLRSADLCHRAGEDHLDRELRSRGLTWSDVRAEQKRRDEAAKNEYRTRAKVREFLQCFEDLLAELNRRAGE